MFLFYALHCVYTKYMFARGAPWFIGGKMYWNQISIFSLTAAPTMWYWKCIFLCAPSTSCETCKEMPIQSMNNHEMKHPISIPLISNSSPYICQYKPIWLWSGISNQAAGFLFHHFIAPFVSDLLWIFSRQYVVKLLQGKSLSRFLQPAALPAPAKDPQIHPPCF